MKIYSVFDDKFRCYGRVIEGYDTSELVKTLTEVTPLPDGVDYVAEQPELQGLPITGELSSRFYGGMPIQMGWCNGHSTKLNCLEYHRCSEINIGSDDFVLLVGKLYDVDPEDGAKDLVFSVRAPDGRGETMIVQGVIEINSCTAFTILFLLEI